MNKNEFVTADLYLAAAISILLKSPPTFKVEKGKTLFLFPTSDRLFKAMTDFHNGKQLNAYEYSLIIKRLRAEMLIRRNGEVGK